MSVLLEFRRCEHPAHYRERAEAPRNLACVNVGGTSTPLLSQRCWLPNSGREGGADSISGSRRGISQTAPREVKCAAGSILTRPWSRSALLITETEDRLIRARNAGLSKMPRRVEYTRCKRDPALYPMQSPGSARYSHRRPLDGASHVTSDRRAPGDCAVSSRYRSSPIAARHPPQRARGIVDTIAGPIATRRPSFMQTADEFGLVCRPSRRIPLDAEVPRRQQPCTSSRQITMRTPSAFNASARDVVLFSHATAIAAASGPHPPET